MLLSTIVVNSYLKDEPNKVLFVRTSFLGWVISHIFFLIFFMILFEFVVDWERKYYSKKKIDDGLDNAYIFVLE